MRLEIQMRLEIRPLLPLHLAQLHRLCSASRARARPRLPSASLSPCSKPTYADCSRWTLCGRSASRPRCSIWTRCRCLMAPRLRSSISACGLSRRMLPFFCTRSPGSSRTARPKSAASPSTRTIPTLSTSSQPLPICAPRCSTSRASRAGTSKRSLETSFQPSRRPTQSSQASSCSRRSSCCAAEWTSVATGHAIACRRARSETRCSAPQASTSRARSATCAQKALAA
mmetsp:Transcript_15008/g.32594  ORF Transcript_15008/g.32594 Transcript_15008/m.32594 type:complete len:228 (-) Transcript_15008:640-1323(-)